MCCARKSKWEVLFALILRRLPQKDSPIRHLAIFPLRLSIPSERCSLALSTSDTGAFAPLESGHRRFESMLYENSIDALRFAFSIMTVEDNDTRATTETMVDSDVIDDTDHRTELEKRPRRQSRRIVQNRKRGTPNDRDTIGWQQDSPRSAASPRSEPSISPPSEGSSLRALWGQLGRRNSRVLSLPIDSYPPR